jgi:Fe-S cluster assembly iron-binding protein IscA
VPARRRTSTSQLLKKLQKALTFRPDKHRQISLNLGHACRHRIRLISLLSSRFLFLQYSKRAASTASIFIATHPERGVGVGVVVTGGGCCGNQRGVAVIVTVLNHFGMQRAKQKCGGSEDDEDRTMVFPRWFQRISYPSFSVVENPHHLPLSRSCWLLWLSFWKLWEGRLTRSGARSFWLSVRVFVYCPSVDYSSLLASSLLASSLLASSLLASSP